MKDSREVYWRRPENLLPGDVIAVGEKGDPYDTHIERIDLFPGGAFLKVRGIQLSLRVQDKVQVFAFGEECWEPIRCLLCKQPQCLPRTEHEQRPSAIVCGLCDAQVSRRVRAMREVGGDD